MRYLAVITMLVLALSLAQPVAAQNLKAGWDAYKRGDYGTALKNLRPLAEQGHADAQFWLGAMYELGKGVIQDSAEAARWYRKAAGVQSITPSYDDGAEAYVLRNDYATTLKHMRPLAKQGLAVAQLYLGIMYYQGHGVTRDYKEAVRWYRKAAEQGDAIAQYNLGWMYNDGSGVGQDYKAAVRWWRKAAKQGQAEAQTSLGMMYSNGQGVLKDNIMAYVWFNIAAADDSKLATDNRDFIASRLDRTELKKARKLSRLCLKKLSNCPKYSD